MISFFVPEIFKFSYYANLVTDDVIGCANTAVWYKIKNISTNETMLLKLNNLRNIPDGTHFDVAMATCSVPLCSGRLSVWKGTRECRTTTHQSDKPNNICLIEHPRFARNYSLNCKVTNPETAVRTVPETAVRMVPKTAVRMVPKTSVKDCDEP